MLRFEKIMHVIKMKRYVTENRTYGMLENAGKMEKNSETVCKTVCQYNKNSIKAEDMEKLMAIAEDYRKVKNYVYERYGGKGGLPKLYPGYTVQNEMTVCGLRAELAMPSVYFYLAVFDALGNIKSQWTLTKSKVLKLTARNENFTEEERHYIRFVLKSANVFEAVLNQKPVRLPKEMQSKLNELAQQADTEKLNRYICRQVRKYHVKLHSESVSGFSIGERAYRYGDHGIYISTKESRKRIFIPLTDSNQYKSQLYIKLYPEKRSVEIKAPLNVSVHTHADYCSEVGLALGMYTMLTTNEGRVYGGQFGDYQTRYAEWLREQARNYSRNWRNNPGRKKYEAKKNRYLEQLHSYINHELNLFFQIEKPQRVYMVKLPRPQAGGMNKKINHGVALWQRGYIRKRLAQKCREQSVELIQVLGKDISNECSNCGGMGSKRNGNFLCRDCGYSIEEKTNTARNVLKRGLEGKTVNW